MPEKLETTLHNFNYKNYRYVYPVVSRRLGGLSIGINLVNQCNWDCVYCDAPKERLIGVSYHNVDLKLFKKELDFILGQVINEGFGRNEFKSITIAGNGEPTLSDDLGEVFKTISELRQKYNIGANVKTLLITNGSRLGEKRLQDAIRFLSTINGEVWFKIDSIVETSIKAINRCRVNSVEVMRAIEIVSKICPLYIQTCFFKLNNALPTEIETNEYLSFLSAVKDHILGVFLYTASRKPFGDFGVTVEAASFEYLEKLNSRIQNLGIESRFYK